MTVGVGNPSHFLVWFIASERASLLCHNKETEGTLLTDNRHLHCDEGVFKLQTRRPIRVVLLCKKCLQSRFRNREY